MASEVCMDKRKCKIWTAGSPKLTHTQKRMGNIMVIALFTSEFPTIQLCDHHILEHNQLPSPQLTLRISTLSLQLTSKFYQTGWKDQELQRQ